MDAFHSLQIFNVYHKTGLFYFKGSRNIFELSELTSEFSLPDGLSLGDIAKQIIIIIFFLMNTCLYYPFFIA